MSQVNEAKTLAGEQDSESPLTALASCPFCGLHPTDNDKGVFKKSSFSSMFELRHWCGDKARKIEIVLPRAEAVARVWNTRRSAWRSIDSAPKDGSTVILFWPGYGNGVTVGFYLDNSQAAHPWQGWKVFSGQIARYGRPIAWQPLPPVPEMKVEETK